MFVLSGEVRLASGETLGDAKILVLGGEPLDEPIVSYGPFVMNSMKEIEQAFVDFNSGKMGTVGEIERSQN